MNCFHTILIWCFTIHYRQQQNHYVKSTQIRTYFWSEYRKIRTRINFVFGHFSSSETSMAESITSMGYLDCSFKAADNNQFLQNGFPGSTFLSFLGDALRLYCNHQRTIDKNILVLTTFFLLLVFPKYCGSQLLVLCAH